LRKDISKVLLLIKKKQLKQLLRKHSHHTITPEIRRELFSSKSRGEEIANEENPEAMDQIEENPIEEDQMDDNPDPEDEE